MTDKTTLIEDKAPLIDYIASGEKPKADWRIGTEHEKFCYRLSDMSPVAYGGGDGIGAILRALAELGWEAVYEGDNIIALKQGGASITLEPGGQFELSGAMLESIHETCNEVHTHLAQVREVGQKLGVGFFGLGFHPTAARADIPIMPKGRYDIMRDYMPTKGGLGLDMMLRTATVQVNLDYSSEADMVKKFRVALALQPVATALFANSPFTEGKPNGFKSYRSHIWTDTDPDRTGMLPFVFDDGFGYERWVDYVLDVPMYFVYRDGKYINAAGQSFRDFMNGNLPALPGEVPTMSDWMDHMTTVFPEVRLKTFLEMRGADGGPWSRLCALPALWVGLLYDQSCLDAAYDLVKDWSQEDMAALRDGVPKLALQTPFGSGTVRELAEQVLDISVAGLQARGKLNRMGENESGFLNALRGEVATGKVLADELLEQYENAWGGRICHVFDATRY